VFFYIIKRVLSMLFTIFFVITLTFFLMHAIPGGPFTSEKALAPEVQKALNEKYHLDDSLLKQYGDYLFRVIRFDLGPSFKYPGITVNELIKKGFPVSCKAGFLAVLLVVFAGIPAGIIAAVRQNRWEDRFLMSFATLGIAIPSFVLATVSIYIFSLKLGWFPTFGVSKWQGYVLPVIALSGFWLAFVARLTRSSLLEVLKQDYMVTAKAKGLYPRQIFLRHGLKNALIPVVTVLGPVVANLLSGSFVIEQVFALPGIGKYFVQSISNRDYTTIMGITIFYAVFLIVMIFIVDMLYLVIDPRIKFEKSES